MSNRKRPVHPRTSRPASGQRKRPPKAPPDLKAIHEHLCDAICLVAVAHDSIATNMMCPQEQYVLQLGVEKLDEVYEQLDRAISQLDPATGSES